ncbi:hypothetical protein [Rhizorhabdus dicambivorans]|uniref:Uncharacterized protein n=1 Tax=Rhizorhabdus dicambivorans TaxID=1850238 RepID=A0A2A4FYJ3_9SPHN|nr:hypothetical protein [Rhizorhabdus dicambivorans]ATE64155.1 hypothetical protein CMV14_06915 [Rhizorhabdus dicambivorans]PCE42574.1 hypothetical protein COO09_09165 [Rhizorhabdus dicambivorans]
MTEIVLGAQRISSRMPLAASAAIAMILLDSSRLSPTILADICGGSRFPSSDRLLFQLILLAPGPMSLLGMAALTFPLAARPLWQGSLAFAAAMMLSLPLTILCCRAATAIAVPAALHSSAIAHLCSAFLGAWLVRITFSAPVGKC